jgi:hypothetical protein
MGLATTASPFSFTHHGVPTMDLKTIMNVMVALIEQRLSEVKSGDIHLTVCHEIAEHFDLWEPSIHPFTKKKGESFPLWLSFVVAGMMREKGIEN